MIIFFISWNWILPVSMLPLVEIWMVSVKCRKVLMVSRAGRFWQNGCWQEDWMKKQSWIFSGIMALE